MSAETAATTTKPRIHVLLSRDGCTGVVIRRGPPKYVCTIGWNRREGTFVKGQWLRGRIYGRRCHLSPDGTYLIFFAINGHWNSEVRGSWTAVSRAPISGLFPLRPKDDCLNGGGLFLSNDTLLTAKLSSEELVDKAELHDFTGYKVRGDQDQDTLLTPYTL